MIGWIVALGVYGGVLMFTTPSRPFWAAMTWTVSAIPAFVVTFWRPSQQLPVSSGGLALFYSWIGLWFVWGLLILLQVAFHLPQSVLDAARIAVVLWPFVSTGVGLRASWKRRSSVPTLS